MTNFHTSFDHQASRPSFARDVFGNPADVLDNRHLSKQEKREILAEWASDANAVTHMPTLRQLPDGSIVSLNDILKALKALDETHQTSPRVQPWRKPFKGRAGLRPWFRVDRSADDDDDDPPPCPAVAARRPRDGGGATFAVVSPEAAAA